MILFLYKRTSWQKRAMFCSVHFKFMSVFYLVLCFVFRFFFPLLSVTASIKVIDKCLRKWIQDGTQHIVTYMFESRNFECVGHQFVWSGSFIVCIIAWSEVVLLGNNFSIWHANQCLHRVLFYCQFGSCSWITRMPIPTVRCRSVCHRYMGRWFPCVFPDSGVKLHQHIKGHIVTELCNVDSGRVNDLQFCTFVALYAWHKWSKGKKIYIYIYTLLLRVTLFCKKWK